MKEFDYLNLDVYIGRGANAWSARVLPPSGLAPSIDFDLSNLTTLESFSNFKDEAAAISVGRYLFGALFGTNNTRTAFEETVQRAKEQNKRVRVRLRFDEIPELLSLPWEFMYDPERGFLSTQEFTPIVRFLTSTRSSDTSIIVPPLRILVMIANPSDHEELNTELEWQALNDALANLKRTGDVQLERVPVQTIEGLQEYLQRSRERSTFHVFHFIGHGGVDLADGKGVVYFTRASGKGVPITGDQLGTVLSDYSSIRLAFLNSCKSASTTPASFASVAHRLVKKGIDCVVGMQFDITDDSAHQFAKEFYINFAGHTVEYAMATARKMLFAKDIRTDSYLTQGTNVVNCAP